MSWTIFFIGILPLIIFVIVDFKAGMKAGIVTAIAVAILMGIYPYFETGSVDSLIIAEIIFLAVLGGVSIKLNNSSFFKFQPTIVGVIVGSYIGYLQIFVEPVMIKYLPLAISMKPDMEPILRSPEMYRLMSLISGWLAVTVYIHAGLIAYAALKLSNIGWILMRLSIYPLLIILFIGATIYVKMVPA